MATAQGSKNIRKRFKKTEKGTRRAWSTREEEVLLACLKELVAGGWKTENEMRPGYMKKLEIAMGIVFPGTDLRVDPHISSRIQVWKKNYASLVTILGTSGVGFKADHTVDCDDAQWEYFERVDGNAHHIRKHSWPLYEGWKECFGKDRATGDAAEDVFEAVDVLLSDTVEASQGNEGKGKEKVDDTEVEGEDTTSFCQSSKLDTGRSRQKKKSGIENSGNMCALLEQIHRDTNATLQTFAARFAYSADLSIARKKLFEIIKLIPGLTSQILGLGRPGCVRGRGHTTSKNHRDSSPYMSIGSIAFRRYKLLGQLISLRAYRYHTHNLVLIP